MPAAVPRCCSTPGQDCHVGCFDELYVRNLAKRLVKVCLAYLGEDDPIGRWWTPFQRAAAAYHEAIRDPRSHRAWPPLAFNGHPTTDWSGWAINASPEDVMALANAPRGPVAFRVERRSYPDGFERVTGRNRHNPQAVSFCEKVMPRLRHRGRDR